MFDLSKNLFGSPNFSFNFKHSQYVQGVFTQASNDLANFLRHISILLHSHGIKFDATQYHSVVFRLITPYQLLTHFQIKNVNDLLDQRYSVRPSDFNSMQTKDWQSSSIFDQDRPSSLSWQKKKSRWFNRIPANNFANQTQKQKRKPKNALEIQSSINAIGTVDTAQKLGLVKKGKGLNQDEHKQNDNEGLNPNQIYLQNESNHDRVQGNAEHKKQGKQLKNQEQINGKDLSNEENQQEYSKNKSSEYQAEPEIINQTDKTQKRYRHKNGGRPLLQRDEQFQVQKFVADECSKGKYITMQHIADYAKKIASYNQNLKYFVASIGWVRNFLKRYPKIRKMYETSKNNRQRQRQTNTFERPLPSYNIGSNQMYETFNYRQQDNSMHYLTSIPRTARIQQNKANMMSIYEEEGNESNRQSKGTGQEQIENNQYLNPSSMN